MFIYVSLTPAAEMTPLLPLSEEIKQISPDLVFLRLFPNTSTKVCLVENRKDSQRYILKLADKRRNPFIPEGLYKSRLKHVQREERVLRELSDLEGITHLVEAYENDNYIAILKEFQKGIPLNGGGTLKDYYALKRIIGSIHARGIVRIDVRYNNIIKNPGPKLYEEYESRRSSIAIIDLGSCMFHYEVTLKEFDKLARKDLSDLELIFSKSL